MVENGKQISMKLGLSIEHRLSDHECKKGRDPNIFTNSFEIKGLRILRDKELEIFNLVYDGKQRSDGVRQCT